MVNDFANSTFHCLIKMTNKEKTLPKINALKDMLLSISGPTVKEIYIVYVQQKT